MASTTIDLPPQPAGQVRFTCAMGRYRGRIEFVDGDPVAAASLAHVLFDRSAHRGVVLGALIPLPVAGLGALFLLDGPVAAVVVVALLAVWVGTWAWAAAASSRLP